MAEMRRLMDQEKKKIERTQQKTINRIRDACAKVNLTAITNFATVRDENFAR